MIILFCVRFLILEVKRRGRERGKVECSVISVGGQKLSLIKTCHCCLWYCHSEFPFMDWLCSWQKSNMVAMVSPFNNNNRDKLIDVM